MKVIIVISPEFLEAICKEGEKYSFQIQGYGSFLKAADRLIYTNVEDILGFAYLGRNLPERGTEEGKAMYRFLRLCNRMDANKKFLFLLQGQMRSEVTKTLRPFKSLKIAYQDGIEFVTDTLINKQLFGSILLDNYEPYLLKEEKREEDYFLQRDFQIPITTFVPIVPEILFQVLEEVHFMDSLEDTFETDLILQRYPKNDVVILFRKILIIRKMKGDSSKLENSLFGILKDYDGKMDGICRAFLNRIKEMTKE